MTLHITVNGEPREISPGQTLAALVAEMGVAAPALATAINGEFVARELRSGRELREGDAVFTFQPITGG